MKLLLDENLPPRLIASLSDVYPSMEHVHFCNLGGATDNAVWDYAKAHGFTIVSKDSDFSERSFLYGSPPKVIWIRLGNCSTTEIESLFRTAKELIQKWSYRTTMLTEGRYSGQLSTLPSQSQLSVFLPELGFVQQQHAPARDRYLQY